ncbi:hypothetical protein BVG19_g4365 [[Candida] boidinii]|nr:hypothetical protein BVG19_g4365 [[Candida] boidinii]OWB50915.1 hypothetical protein B5S27_g2469 [[Candida] boidinii]
MAEVTGSKNLKQGAEVPASVSLIAGSVSGLVSRFVIAPIDIIKIRLQLQADPMRTNGIIKTLTSIVKNEGITALWKGNVPAEFMYVIYGATQFTLYSSLNKTLSHLETSNNFKLSNTTHSLIIGSTAGCMSTFISYPFDVLRTRLASNRSNRFLSVYKTTLDILANEGIKGFFGGLKLSMVYVAASMGLSFGSYNFFKDHLENTSIESSSGLLAGIFSKTLVYPMDLLRRRQQISASATATANNIKSEVSPTTSLPSPNSTTTAAKQSTKSIIDNSVLHMTKTIYKAEGIRGFYHGLLPALIKTAPTTAVSFFMYELTVNLLSKFYDQTYHSML